MNISGTTEDNWRWRFTWGQLLPFHKQRLARAIKLYGRD